MDIDLKQLSDESLMKLYQEGDEMAFEVLYTRHSPKIYAFLTKKVGDTALASDLLQETFFKLHNSRNSYNSDYPFLPWIFTISKNTIVDSMRKMKKSIKTLPINEEILTQNLDVAENNKIAILEPMLGNLPENQKKALTLRYLEDWTFEDIAQILQTSPANSRKLISRGIKSIKNTFSKMGESE